MVSLAVWNESSVVSDADVAAIMRSLAVQWNRDLVYLWNVEVMSWHLLPKGVAAQPNQWWAVFLDDSDQAGALAYHDLTAQGLPLAKIFCRTLIDDGASISVGASHELCEMAVDPYLNCAFQDSNGVFWAAEVCDPVEDDLYAYTVAGHLVSDVITPAWYAPQNATGPLDHQQHASTPFAVLTGGYAQYFDPSQGWVQTLGADAATHARKATPPAGSRRERRDRQHREPLKRSAPAHQP